MYDYDDQNIFAKILRGEIPNKTAYEDDHVLAFHDIQPRAPIHVLVIPKGAYVNYDHFAGAASEAEIVAFTRAVATVCRQTGAAVAEGGSGYRLISNSGDAGVQEVPHFHVHVLGGRVLGPIVGPE
ncbi:MAG: HIT domain-containing protein [Pseudomonadota bacterium]